MFSIISFNNVRTSSMKKNPVMPYAALGVGLAVMLTVGLTAIAGVVEQPVVEVQLKADEEAAMKAAPPAAPAAPPSEMAQREADVSSEPEPMVGSYEPSVEEKIGLTQEQQLVTEAPVSPFAGLSMAIPYIAAAIVGSAVFAVVRKRAGF
jgi:hypothetical protein